MSFSKSWNCTSSFGECNLSFLKHSLVQINFKLNEENRLISYLIYTNMLKFLWKKARKICFLKSFFRIWENVFLSVCTKFLSLLYMISLAYKFSRCLSANHKLSRITMCNLQWCYTFCTGVTLFVLVLHLNCTVLSQLESGNLFMCTIIPVSKHALINW